MPTTDYNCIIDRGHSEINDRIIDFLKTKIKGRYLDIGANSGWLLREVPGGVGVDNSPIFASEQVIIADATNLPFKDKEFDTVVLSCILEQCPDWKSALKEAQRVGKRVIGINPIPGSPWGKIGGWVKSVIDREAFPYTEDFDQDRYYFEI